MATDHPTFVAGLRSTGANFLASGERPKNFRETILWLDPNGMTPITAMSSQTPKETTDDPEVNWYEEVLDAKRGTLTNAPGTSGTTFTLEDPGDEADGVRADNPALAFLPGDIVQAIDMTTPSPATYKTGAELCLVTAVSGNDLTVTRDFGDTRTTNLALAAGDRILLVGKAFGEGTASPNTQTSKPVLKTNFCQIFKTAFQLTNTAKQTRFRTGDAFANERKRKMFLHSEALEQAYLWGVAKDDTGDAPRRLMGGLRWFMESNVDVAVGAPDADFFMDTLAPLFNFNAGGAGDQRICFIGNGALTKINKAIRDETFTQVEYAGKIEIFKIKLLQLEIPQGTFFLKTHPLLNTDPVFTNSMFVMNPRGLINRPLRGRDTKIQQNIQGNDEDKRKDQWLTETTMELQFERTQGYFSGLT